MGSISNQYVRLKVSLPTRHDLGGLKHVMTEPPNDKNSSRHVFSPKICLGFVLFYCVDLPICARVKSRNSFIFIYIYIHICCVHKPLLLGS